jgi:hypothetical protein
MKWLQLKMQMLPSISDEIELNIREYKMLVSQIGDASFERGGSGAMTAGLNDLSTISAA